MEIKSIEIGPFARILEYVTIKWRNEDKIYILKEPTRRIFFLIYFKISQNKVTEFIKVHGFVGFKFRCLFMDKSLKIDFVICYVRSKKQNGNYGGHYVCIALKAILWQFSSVIPKEVENHPHKAFLECTDKVWKIWMLSLKFQLLKIRKCLISYCIVIRKFLNFLILWQKISTIN